MAALSGPFEVNIKITDCHIYYLLHSGTENLKSPDKKLVNKLQKKFREISFLAVLNFFPPVQKLIFGQF